ncbi:MAG: sigma-54 dependent transcriptional regulator [Desulfuromonas sp.]|nr:sigma-54 dependent transcriptional regulator [Desulfuromonas sp.]
MAKILIVDDEERIREILAIMLEGHGHSVTMAGNGLAAVEILQQQPVDMVISDIRMDGMDGLTLLSTIKKNNIACPVVFITAFGTTESAVNAMRLGAVDYLVKPFEEKSVVLAVERALGVRSIMAENAQLRRAAQQHGAVQVIFASKAMKQVHQMALRVGPSEASVLITGESGTGKEVVARIIHQASKKGRFVALNCAAIAPSLLESELFGHEKGAFTGADKDRVGKFEFAANGTLFLDEIGELPLEAQAKLLRALQEKHIQRLGSNIDIAINCRLLCATNRDLVQQVKQGTFREDLYYRLAVFPIHIPPLRERREDIIPLVSHCLQRQKIKLPTKLLTPAAQQLLMNYRWPGNVRELFNAVERAVILKSGDAPFNSDDFCHIETTEPLLDDGENFCVPAGGIDYDELQRTIVKQVLEMANGNQSSAARLLGVTRSRFRTLLGLLENE